LKESFCIEDLQCELFTYFADWKIERVDEVIFEDNSGGVPHYHCMDTIICRKVT